MSKLKEFFDRSEIAERFDLDYSVVKNWSTGKPLTIEPSVRPQGTRGKLGLYSRHEMYRFAIASHMADIATITGLYTFKMIEDMITWIKDEWLDIRPRGEAILFYVMQDDEWEPRVIYWQPDRTSPPFTRGMGMLRKAVDAGWVLNSGAPSPITVDLSLVLDRWDELDVIVENAIAKAEVAKIKKGKSRVH